MTPSQELTLFVWGALAMGCWVAGLVFLRFWKEARDRLFVIFACAFWVLGLNWVVLALFHPGEETRHYVYMIRLVAFLLIIGAIVDKNRSGGSRRRPPPLAYQRKLEGKFLPSVNGDGTGPAVSRKARGHSQRRALTMGDKIGFIVPLVLMLAGLYVLFAAFAAGEQVSLAPGMEVPKRIAYMLGGIGVFGGVVVGFEMLGRRRTRSRPRAGASDDSHV
ncbi:MAG: DUF5985 family protein [Candidatus Binatia bacterium]